jgi:hypothetical protein
MTGQTLLERLDCVRRMGASRWVARCPSHDDRRPSLALRELDDGRLLVFCRAGCATTDVLSSVGLSFADLYPERLPEHRYPPVHRPFDALSCLICLADEVELASLAVDNLANGFELTDEDRARLRQAASRIRAIEERAHG